MNFKKIALVLALSSGFAAHADVLSDLTALTVPGFVAAEVLSASGGTVYQDFLAFTPAGNTAYVLQDSNQTEAKPAVAAIPANGDTPAVAAVPAVPSEALDGGSVAYVVQQDAGNFAVVMQQGKSGFAYINQKADESGANAAVNKAMIVQIDTGADVRAIDLAVDIGTKSVDDLALAEIASDARVLSASGKGNVALIGQSDTEAYGTANTALIYQKGTDNFAAISQNANPAVANDAYIAQSGKGMVAYIVQK